ncbi:STAS/SEC14 domain-containing protein [Nitratifractor sp.]
MAIIIEEHGVGLSLESNGERFLVQLKMKGKLTHEDYEIFVPILDRALKKLKGPEADLLADMREFKGWKGRAAWDDLLFGLKHRKAFKKVAVVGKKKWEELATAMMRPLMKGKIRFFRDYEEARRWLTGEKR